MNATAGAYAIAQSGQPWEAWDYKACIPLVGTNTSDLIRNAEPAGPECRRHTGSST